MQYVLFTLRVIALLGCLLMNAYGRQIEVIDHPINIAGLLNGDNYEIPKAAFFTGGDLGDYPPDRLGIHIGGQQGGSWLDSFNVPSGSDPDRVYFNPTRACEVGAGACLFRVVYLDDPQIFSNDAWATCYVPGAVTLPVADSDQFPPFLVTDLIFEGDVLANDNVGNPQDPGIGLSLEVLPLTVPGVTASQGFDSSGDPLIRLDFGPGGPFEGAIPVQYRIRNGCLVSNITTANFVIVAPPVLEPDSYSFRLDEPIIIPIKSLIANDASSAPLDAGSIVITGMQGGNTQTIPSSGTPTWIQFGLSTQNCDDERWFEYTISDVDGTPATGSARVTLLILPPDPDCNSNCMVDAQEPDDDGDGIPNDCELVIGPCDVRRSVPGSVLVFPLFDNRVGNVTLATVTNTNTSLANGPGGLPAGTVDVEFVYIGRYGPGNVDLPCLESNFTHRLTPGDTITLYTAAENPNAERGFFYAFANDPQSGIAISWNYLAGELLLLSADSAVGDSIQAVSFRSPGRDRSPTDVDADGIRDLDGIEYDGAPAELFVPRFLGQDPVSELVGFSDRLILIALSGGNQFETIVSFSVFNDNEQPFSSTYQFRCWDDPLLTSISGVFLNEFLLTGTDNAAGEFLGAPPREYGWFKLDGARAFSTQDEIVDPAIYAVLLERIGAHIVSSPPFEFCSQHNGDLVATGIFAED